MKFNDMQYVHLDMQKLKEEIIETVEKFKSAKTFDEADKAFYEYGKICDRVETQSALAYIRHTVNTLDEFYDREQEFLDESLPVLSEYFQMMTKALLESPFRAKFTEKYGELMFINEEMELKTFSPEIVADLQEENKLVTEYEKLLASAQIDFRGEICTVSQLTPYKQSADDEIRLQAWTAEGNFYKENKAELDRLFEELVHLRDKIAKKLGFEDFTTLGYYRMKRNSYTKEDVAKFRTAVQKYLVPLADKIYRETAERIGKDYPLNYADSALMFRSGNPKPCGSADDILKTAEKFYHELSPETAEFIDFMLRNELLDVLSKKGKAQGGYCIEIPDYKAEFIFANFNGTSDDVETVTHEAGHAFAGYTARDIFPAALRMPTMESCEIHSMSMEFFAWKAAEEFYGEEADKFKYSHLASAIKFIPYGTMVDHFQHIVYEHPELTPEQRDDAWKELTGVYMPWIKLGEIPFYGDGCAWQRQHHIYSSPFYYIDYCFAQTVALEFWALIQKDENTAWESYKKLVGFAGTKKFTDLVKDSGLGSPFDEKTLKSVCKEASDWLANFDKSKLV